MSGISNFDCTLWSVQWLTGDLSWQPPDLVALIEKHKGLPLPYHGLLETMRDDIEGWPSPDVIRLPRDGSILMYEGERARVLRADEKIAVTGPYQGNFFQLHMQVVEAAALVETYQPGEVLYVVTKRRGFSSGLETRLATLRAYAEAEWLSSRRR